MGASVIPWLGHDPMSLEDFQVVFTKYVAAENFFIAERDGAVAGFYRVSRFEGRGSHVAEIGTVAVHPEQRGSGLAREMIAAVLEELKAAGIIRVQLMIEPDNARGRAFYERMGFHQEAILRRGFRRFGQPGETDDVVMVRFLDV
jgi:putative acetyltransferase